jgi:hypothetical protein
VERKYVSNFIQNIFRAESDLLSEYIFKLDYYDEKTDSFLFIKALKVNTT